MRGLEVWEAYQKLIPHRFYFFFIYSLMKTRIVVSLAALFAIVTLGFGQTLTDSNLHVQTVLTGLTGPTGMAFLGSNPNDFFVIEKDTGRVKRVLNGSAS